MPRTLQQQQSGGTIINNIAELAIPFGLVIAERSLNQLFKKKPAPPARRGPKPNPIKSPKQRGGDSDHSASCVLCKHSPQPATQQLGGKDQRNMVIQRELAGLANQLKRMLDTANLK